MEKCLLIRVEIEAKFCNNTNTHLFNAINYKKKEESIGQHQCVHCIKMYVNEANACA